MGLVHVANAARTAGGRLAAVGSARPVEVAGLRARSYDELLASDVDALVIAVRSVDHAELACAALERGKHVLLEKPGATTLADHDRLAAAAAQRPELVVQVA